MWRRFLFRVSVIIIRKYFAHGISVITDTEENIIAYK